VTRPRPWSGPSGSFPLPTRARARSGRSTEGDRPLVPAGRTRRDPFGKGTRHGLMPLPRSRPGPLLRTLPRSRAGWCHRVVTGTETHAAIDAVVRRLHGGARELRPAWRLGTVPRLRGGASSWGGSDSPVQVELFPEALTPGVLRDRGRRGGSYSKATRYTDSGRFGVPPGRSGAPAGAAWQQAPAAPRPGNPIASALFLDQLDRPCHSRVGVNHVRAGPGEVAASLFDVASCPLNARAAAQPHPTVRTPSTLIAITIPALHASASPVLCLPGRGGPTVRALRRQAFA
jgi:hypothetical protein